MKMLPNFEKHLPESELHTLLKIALRATEELAEAKMFIVTCTNLAMIHTYQYPLDLPRLLKADPLRFRQEILGINKNMSKETGRLTDSFVPYYRKENHESGEES